MKTGKLPPDVLSRLLAKTRLGPDVLIGPALGEDAAAMRFGGKVLVAAADPVTFTSDRIGCYAVSVNANDIATHGAEPRYFLATVLLPEGSTEKDTEAVFDQINSACSALGVALIGGHTEVTQAVDRVVVSGCMLGEVAEDALVRTAGARVGDTLILVGAIAIEGTCILAREAPEDLTARGVSWETVESAKKLLDDPGICIVEYARAAVSAGGVTSLHDPTEGGLATALRELAAACGHGMSIRRDSIPILDECSSICSALHLDPLGLIASGSLLVAVSPDHADVVLSALVEERIPAGVIGVIVNAEYGVLFDDGSSLPFFERDELARYSEERNHVG